MTTDDDSMGRVVDAGRQCTSDQSAARPALAFRVSDRIWRGAFLAVVAALSATGCTTSSGGGIPLAPAPVTAPAVVSASPSTRPAAGPPFIARVAWVSGSGGRSLQVYPTPAGRVAALSGSVEAWHEVLRYAADAGTPGMQAQFDCHWTFARIVEPDKTSWNIEPWRPVVSQSEMRRSRCNPGGAEETVTSAADLPGDHTAARPTGTSP